MILNRNRMFAATAVSMSLFALGLATSPAIASAESDSAEWAPEYSASAREHVTVSQSSGDTFIYPTCYTHTESGRYASTLPLDKGESVLHSLGYENVDTDDKKDGSRLVIETTDSAETVGKNFLSKMVCGS